MSTAETQTPRRVPVGRLVFTSINAVGVLACLVWSLYLRHVFLLECTRCGVRVPLLLGALMHWALWVLVALGIVVLLFLKDRVRRAWVSPVLNVLAIPVIVGYYFLLPIVMFIGACDISAGTWDDDPLNWRRAFHEDQPACVEVIHSRYWRSNHWTDEYIYHFEVQATPEWRGAYLKKRGLVPVPPEEARDFRTYHDRDSTPHWFAPDPVTNYEVWDLPGYHGEVYINKATGHMFFSEAFL